MSMSQTILHKNAARGGPSIKGIECRRCGAYVGLAQGKSGKWYTCELHPSMSETSQALIAYPWESHSENCGRAQREEDQRRSERELELRTAIIETEKLLERLGHDQPQSPLLLESIAAWQQLLISEGFETA